MIPNRDDLHTLARYLFLKLQYPDSVPDLLVYLRASSISSPSVDEATKALASLFFWDPVEVKVLLAALAARSPQPPALTAILDVARALDVARDNGLGIELLRSLNQNGFIFGGEGVTPLLQAIAGSDADAALQLRGRIAEMKRSILQIFAIPAIDSVTQPHGFRVLDQDNLSDYLLVDVAMGAETDTSRVVQGTLSLQQYVQRVRLGLEPWVTNFGISNRRWGWMDSYRTWEANRRVFLYPENYLRPELRRDKTPLFDELLDAVNGADITKEQAEKLYRGYLDGLVSVATLRTVGAYYTEESTSDYTIAPGKTIGRFHLIGRTTTKPYVYHHRTYDVALGADGRRTAARWTPWKRIGVEISADYATPVVFRGQLYLFWSEAVFTPEEGTIGGGHFRVKLQYAVKSPDGTWGAAQSGFPQIDLAPDVVPASNLIWRRPYVVPTTYQEAPALFVQYGDYAGSCDPFLFVLRLDQTVVTGLKWSDAMDGPASLKYSALDVVDHPGKISLLTGASFSAANALPLSSCLVGVFPDANKKMAGWSEYLQSLGHAGELAASVLAGYLVLRMRSEERVDAASLREGEG